MEEKIIVKGRSAKINVLTILFGLVTVVFLYLALDMVAGGDSNAFLWIIFAVVAAAITALIFGVVSCCELIVTDKRVYGKVAFGKQVNLPLDSISAVAATSVLTQGVSVSTASGNITFFYLPNRGEICEKINQLLMERQGKAPDSPTGLNNNNNTDELKKYKELLDAGIITQEEFDAKKKQLLGL